VAVLAGGKSRRMGTDKAFLLYRGSPFVTMITDEMLKTSDDVLVVVGRKDSREFSSILDPSVRVLNDTYDLENPMGGMLSAFRSVKNSYVAFLACDTPFVRAGVIEFLHRAAVGRTAAVPLWEDGRIEPLCAVYDVARAEAAGLKALAENSLGCRYLIRHLEGVNYIKVEDLRRLDPDLVSLRNVNTRAEFDSL